MSRSTWHMASPVYCKQFLIHQYQARSEAQESWVAWRLDDLRYVFILPKYSYLAGHIFPQLQHLEVLLPVIIGHCYRA